MSLADWTPRERPGASVLGGHYATLEPLDWAAHADGLYAAIAGPDNAALWEYMPLGPFADAQTFRAHFTFAYETHGWEPMVIRSAATSDILGSASFMRIREAHGSAEVGCVAFGDQLKRTREATEAMYLMAAHVFDDLGYRRWEWKCHNENAASKRAALRFGFRFEGIFRNDMVVKGANRDTAWFAMTDEDWLTIKLAYQAWLARGNFDESGHQREKLKAAP